MGVLVGLNRILGRLTGSWVVWVVFGWFGWIRILESTRGPVGLTRIASLKTKACDSTDQVVLQLSYTGGVQILHGGHRKEGCVQSFQLERKEQFLQK